jgi:C-terminal processing protease CtpA/Prc
MINMDMIGRLDTARGLAVHGTGTAPMWSGVLDIANQDSIELIKKESGVGPSDHTSFYLQDIPVLHFFTGQHDDYHKPGDDPEKVNYEGIYEIVQLIRRLVVDLDDEEKLTFIKTKNESENTPRFSVTLGVVPDYLFDGEGMRIDGVSEDKPAQKAGMQKGDIVVQLGDSTVTDMMSYMRALSVFEKGDQTRVKFKRGEEVMEKAIVF